MLRDARGRELARLRLEELLGSRVAAVLEVTADPADVAAALWRDFPGWRVAGPPVVGTELVAAGGALRRHAHFYGRDLRADPPPANWATLAAPEGVRFVPADRPASDLEPAWRAAYPPDHPDHAEDPELAAVLAGGAGPILPESELALDAAGDVVAVLLVMDFEGEPPDTGPWVADVFRDPDRTPRGLGSLLLQRALARLAAAGQPSLGLAVSDANASAVRLYERLGFRRTRTIFAVQLPDRTD